MTTRSGIVPFDETFGFGALERCLDRLRAAYPDAEVATIGRSVLGKPIYAIRVGRGPGQAFLNAAFHANEWITSPLALRFAEEALEALRSGGALRGVDAASLFERTSLWVAPMVNPDGVDLVVNGAAAAGPHRDDVLAWNGGSEDFAGWKANIRGVDLNDQFPAYWEVERDRRAVEGPGPRDYTGEAPLTEPEAQAIARFTEERGFDVVVALHTQGREIYWNYRDAEPPEAERIAARMARSSGYAAIKLTGSDAGYKDWFIHRWGRPGFTIEAGFGTNPLPLEQLPGMYEETAAIALEALLASRRGN